MLALLAFIESESESYFPERASMQRQVMDNLSKLKENVNSLVIQRRRSEVKGIVWGGWCGESTARRCRGHVEKGA